MEASCADAPIWNETAKFWGEQANLSRAYLGEPLDLSLLFLAVQQVNTAADPHRANGLEMLIRS